MIRYRFIEFHPAFENPWQYKNPIFSKANEGERE